MAEFIERRALREAFDNADADIVEEYEDGDCDWGFGRQNILEVINSVPAADVAQVRHGRWRFCGSDRWNDVYECGNCGKMATDNSDFCPNCGAKMDLEV